MKFLQIIFLILIPFSSFAKKMVMIGDSLTEGYGVSKESSWPSLVEKKIKSENLDWQVINAGVSGSTSASALQRVKWQLNNPPDLLILALGANDGLRGLSTDEMKKNLSLAIEEAQKNKVKIILIGMKIPPNYGKKYTSSFEKTFPDLAKKFKIPFIPFLLQDVAGISNLNQPDGIHPNEKGHEIIANNIFKQLRPSL